MNKNQARLMIEKMQELYSNYSREMHWYLFIERDQKIDRTTAKEYSIEACKQAMGACTVWSCIEIVNNEAIIYTNEELEKLHFELDEKARKPTSEKLIRCYECGDLDCIHRNAFRRVPKSEGGLGECPRLKKWLMENK